MIDRGNKKGILMKNLVLYLVPEVKKRKSVSQKVNIALIKALTTESCVMMTNSVKIEVSQKDE